MPGDLFPSLPCFVNRSAAALALFMTLAACEGPTKLPVTPNVLRDGSGCQILSQLPPDQHVVDIPVVYVTNRAPSAEPENGPRYGLQRSPSVAYGVATVSLSPQPTWEQFVRINGTSGDQQRYDLKVSKIDERGRFLVDPTSLEMYEGSLRWRAEAMEMLTRESKSISNLVCGRLAASPRKDVYIYVHGVNNTFNDAVTRAAVIWNFIGRQGVMVAYAWPAGQKGAAGYFSDRESGEYAVFHLKRLIQRLAQCPEVERIHIIAHSRGCDVTTTALREINIACRARDLDPQKELKLETLILAAPDMDVEVFSLRLTLENMAVIARRFVVYSSSKDDLVKFADWLFRSRARLGTLAITDVDVPAQELLGKIPNIELIQCYVTGFGTTHDYMFTNPGAMSDLVLVLRDRRDPGAANGRPLTPLGGSFWKLDNTYALPEQKPH